MTAFIDAYSRKIMGWVISNSMTQKWCLEVLDDTIARCGQPEIINPEQGSQYTSPSWTHYLEKKNKDVYGRKREGN